MNLTKPLLCITTVLCTISCSALRPSEKLQAASATFKTTPVTRATPAKTARIAQKTTVNSAKPSPVVSTATANPKASTEQPSSEKSVSTAPVVTPSQVIVGVKTTAYTHAESDHVEYGARTAVGTLLRHGKIRSAAADWSIYPVGTVFQIEGDPSLYVVDDYGSALVGTKTIDLYKPSFSSMNNWGTRRVTIQVIKWGSFEKSLVILKPRAYKAPHIRRMVASIEGRAA